jgi:phosphoglycolate phosphatase
MPRAIVFDLDGTLVDSAPDIHAAANCVLAERDLPQLDLPTIKSFIGNGVAVLMQRCLERVIGPTDPAELQDAVTRFLHHYEREPASRTVLFPGVRDLLAGLTERGDRLGICTNKPEALTRAVLRDLGIDTFEIVIGGDTLPTRKPDPSGLISAIEALDGNPASAIFVGDSEVDGATARAAGVRFALFTCGYRKVPVADIPHWIAHDTFEELHRALNAPEPSCAD